MCCIQALGKRFGSWTLEIGVGNGRCAKQERSWRGRCLVSGVWLLVADGTSCNAETCGKAERLGLGFMRYNEKECIIVGRERIEECRKMKLEEEFFDQRIYTIWILSILRNPVLVLFVTCNRFLSSKGEEIQFNLKIGGVKRVFI